MLLTTALEKAAREVLMKFGAEGLPRPPWLHTSQPPSATYLVHCAVWRDGAREEALLTALTLLPAMRAEGEQIESSRTDLREQA